MNKKLIIGIAIAVLAIGGGAGFFLLKNKKYDRTSFVSETHKIALRFEAPKSDEFKYSTDKAKNPTFTLANSTKKYDAKGVMMDMSKSLVESSSNIGKKNNTYQEFETTSKLKGYSFSDDLGKRIYIKIKEEPKKNDLYLSLRILPNTNKKEADEIYKSDAIQKFIKSIAVDQKYTFVEKDYVTDSREIIKIKKLAKPSNSKWTVRQDESNYAIYNAYEENGKEVVSVSLQPIKGADLAAIIAEDYHVKKGKHSYSIDKKLAGVDIKIAQSENQRIQFFYFKKDGMIYQGSTEYQNDEGKKALDGLFEEVLKGLSVDKEAAKKNL